MVLKNLGTLNGSWRLLFQISLVLLPIGVVVGVTFAVGVNNRFGEHDRQIVSIKSSRWSREDAMLHGATVAKEFADVWHELGEIKVQIAKLPKETPPKWFIERFDRLEVEFQRLKNAIR